MLNIYVYMKKIESDRQNRYLYAYINAPLFTTAKIWD